MVKVTTTNMSRCDLKFRNTCILLLLIPVMTVNGLHRNSCNVWKQTFTATENMTLTSAFWLGKVTSAVKCVTYCHADPNCKSVNYIKVNRICQLSNVAKTLCLDNFITSYGSIYFDDADDSANELLEASQMSDCSMTPNTTREPFTSPAGSGGMWIEQELSVTGKQSTQSSTYEAHHGMFVAGRANDGDTNILMQKDPYCSHTGFESHPWWRVDLGGEHWLGRITVVNRGDSFGYRLAGATVRAGPNSDITNNMVCGSAVSEAQAEDGARIEFVCDPSTLARYVGVDINIGDPTSVINICEVMVRENIKA